MAKLSIKKRTGADLFRYMKMALHSADRANEWAFMKFVYLDEGDKAASLNLQQVLNIRNKKPQTYLTISNSIFPSNTDNIDIEIDSFANFISYRVDDDNCIEVGIKPITSDVIQGLQSAKTDMKKNGEIDLLITMCTKMFKVSIEQLYAFPHDLVMHLCNEVNTFLAEVTTPKNNFDIEDDILFPTNGNDGGGMGKLVSNSDRSSGRNEQTKQKSEQEINNLLDDESAIQDRIVQLQTHSRDDGLKQAMKQGTPKRPWQPRGFA